MEKMVTANRQTMVDQAPYSKALIAFAIRFESSLGATEGPIVWGVNFEKTLLKL
jgi:hypothetical protein